jgi:2-dehydro-3-deoxygalactonokinase
MAGSVRPEWIAVDWGTSNLRAWAMDGADAVIAAADSDDGMGRLTKDEFEGALLRLVGDWLADGQATDIVACGMVGARQGWQEAAYRPVPCTPAGAGALVVAGTDSRIRVSILPGLKQDRPADVMRGEETQIAGYLAQDPGYDGLICLPGTHSKWARVSNGEVISFSTFMSGEMFALLSEQSVLRHGVAKDGWVAEEFARGLTESFEAPEMSVAALFRLRAEGLLHGLSPEAARTKLSGIVLGMELAATKAQWQHAPVVIIGAKGLGGRYAEALRMLGGKAELADGDVMTLAGLVSAYRQMRGEQK